MVGEAYTFYALVNLRGKHDFGTGEKQKTLRFSIIIKLNTV